MDKCKTKNIVEILIRGQSCVYLLGSNPYQFSEGYLSQVSLHMITALMNEVLFDYLNLCSK